MTRDFLRFYLPNLLSSRFRPTPHLDRLPTVQVERGSLIGSGLEKRVFAAKTREPGTGKRRPVVILERRWMWPAKMAEGELCGAEWLRAHGLPVVKTIGKTPGRRPALVQERLASGSKELVSMFLRRDDRALLKSPLNGRTVRTLDRTIAKLRTMRFTLPDLQVLVARDGGIAFNDMVPPQRSRKPVTDLDLRFLLTLREAARYTVDLRGKTP